jgi:hypothetical protein
MNLTSSIEGISVSVVFNDIVPALVQLFHQLLLPGGQRQTGELLQKRSHLFGINDELFLQISQEILLHFSVLQPVLKLLDIGLDSVCLIPHNHHHLFILGKS